jgi:DNA-directed RNA polymerase I and III subunit RPAC2
MTTAVHPRDAHVLYQEQLKRSLDGDVVDTSGQAKVGVELQYLDADKSVATVSFSHEDHTLGNVLRHRLMQNPAVSSAGYVIPHPLEPKMVLHVQSEAYAVDVVADALEGIASLCDDMLAGFEASVSAATAAQ